MRCGIAHAHWFLHSFLSPVFAKKIRRTKYLIRHWLGFYTFFQLIVSISLLLVGISLFSLSTAHFFVPPS